MNQEFYNKLEARKHGDLLYKNGVRNFCMSRYTTAEGTPVYFFDWSSTFTTPEAILDEWVS